MIDCINPAIIMMLGGLMTPLFKGRWQSVWLLIVPVISLTNLLMMGQGEFGQIQVFGLELVTTRIDHLSFIWAVIFHIAAILAMVYSLHVRDNMQHMAGLIYAGSAIGAVLAGDLITLFVYWEITAISSVFLIFARRTQKSYRTGMRYLIIQISSGVILLSGVVLWFRLNGNVAFNEIGIDSFAGKLIFLAFGIKCAFPFLHNWLQDSYPEATVTGTVVLSAFTTKLAVYTLARGFAGTEQLIWIGCVMTVFPIFYAVLENDLRRVLAYSLNNQLGFMVVGIGIGTELALNGTAAHAFCHIIYKALLFMSVGAVLYRTGTSKASMLGGLYKSMPITTVCCMIGAAAISAVPLFSGFVSKGMILAAAAYEHNTIVFIVLLFASAGVVDHSGIKVPFFAFFAHDSGIRVPEAPRHMLVAMIACSVLCIGLALPGVYQKFYLLLPFPEYAAKFEPYTMAHVMTQLQVLFFAGLAFVVLMRKGWYPEEIRAVNLDFDWFYRKVFPACWNLLVRAVLAIHRVIFDAILHGLQCIVGIIARLYNPREGVLGRTWSTGSAVLVTAVFLAIVLVVYYLDQAGLLFAK
jgi:multicomponent Na+:H+ antiporter subunit D